MNQKSKCVLFDINHPAHVHYFRNVIALLNDNGYHIEVTARDKDLVKDLLNEYDISFIDRGRGAGNLIGRFFYYFKAVIIILNQIRMHKADLVVSFMHPYAVHAAKLCNIPSIIFSDTENANLHHRLTVPFATKIHTSNSFNKDLGKKHVRFNGFMELAYLGTKFSVDINSTDKINSRLKTVFFRFVSRKSLHDRSHEGLSDKDKLFLIDHFAKKNYNITISSEVPVPEDIKKYIWRGNKSDIHKVLQKSTIFIGESATMASESSILGIPAIYFDDIGRGYTDVLEKEYHILFRYEESSDGVRKAIKKADELIDSFIDGEKVRKKILSSSVDLTNYMFMVISNSC